MAAPRTPSAIQPHGKAGLDALSSAGSIASTSLENVTFVEDVPLPMRGVACALSSVGAVAASGCAS